MKNPLLTIKGTIIAGLALSLISLIILDWNELGTTGFLGDGSAIYLGFMRFFHVIAGVVWIGLLYYFNFVQVPALKEATADGTAGGITKHIAPLALLWFRWAALATWLAGAALLGSSFTDTFLLKPGYEAIGIGSWMGTIMLFNVWGLIWPNQQKILGIKKASDEEKVVARRVALLASRTNTLLSIPMLLLMTNGLSHRALLGL
jgi:uncharacterized membrane protein|tara:strand:+ start:1203 stop:1814 length:612 start_codon:yes stop_codon:yes gene_type:complete